MLSIPNLSLKLCVHLQDPFLTPKVRSPARGLGPETVGTWDFSAVPGPRVGPGDECLSSEGTLHMVAGKVAMCPGPAQDTTRPLWGPSHGRPKPGAPRRRDNCMMYLSVSLRSDRECMTPILQQPPHVTDPWASDAPRFKTSMSRCSGQALQVERPGAEFSLPLSLPCDLNQGT